MTASIAGMSEGQRLKNALAGLTADSDLIDIYGAMRRVELISRLWLDRLIWPSVPDSLSVDRSLYQNVDVAIRHLQSIVERVETNGSPVATCLVLRSVAGHWASEIRSQVRITRKV